MADPPELHLKDLKAISVLGRGAKGLVFLVEYSPSQSNSTTTHLALKVIPTALRLTRSPSSSSRDDEADHRRRIILERDILSSLHHPLLPSLRGLVSTDHIVGFAIEYCPGGNLSSLRRRQSEQMFSEDAIRFYAAELVLALEHLHGLGIVYRDLKPENILIKSDGHLMVVDFDLSTRIPRTNQPHWRTHSWGSEKSISTWSLSSSSTSSLSSSSTKSNSFVGTEEYLAPEMVEGRGHGFAVDWWGLGVVLYEMLYGRTPFRGRDRRETFHMIVTREPSLVGERTPLRDLLARLLEKDPNRRIGVEAIKTHDFFRGLDWRFVVDVARPPFIPLSLPEEEEEDEEEETIAGGGRCEIDIEKCVGMVFEGRNVDASPLFQVF